MKNEKRGLVLIVLFSILIMVIVIHVLFIGNYTIYKNPTSTNFISEISGHIINKVSLKGRNELYCEKKFFSVDQCFFVIQLESWSGEIDSSRKILIPQGEAFLVKVNKELKGKNFEISAIQVRLNSKIIYVINKSQGK